MEDKRLLTRGELMANRFLAVLLFISSLVLWLNPLNLPTIIIFGLFALFLFFAKRYHIVINIIFLLFALGVYLVPLPIAWGLFLSLRELRWEVTVPIKMLFCLAPFLFVSLAVRNFLGNILLFFRPSLAWRNRLFSIFLLSIMVIILTYPLLTPQKLRQRAMERTTGSSTLSSVITKQELKLEPGESAHSSVLARKYFTADYNSISGKYFYHLFLTDPLVNPIVFTMVKADGEKINFKTDPRVECSDCQTDSSEPYSLIFPAGQGVDFNLSSDQFVKSIEFTETGGSVVEFVFWK